MRWAGRQGQGRQSPLKLQKRRELSERYLRGPLCLLTACLAPRRIGSAYQAGDAPGGQAGRCRRQLSGRGDAAPAIWLLPRRCTHGAVLPRHLARRSSLRAEPAPFPVRSSHPAPSGPGCYVLSAALELVTRRDYAPTVLIGLGCPDESGTLRRKSVACLPADGATMTMKHCLVAAACLLSVIALSACSVSSSEHRVTSSAGGYAGASAGTAGTSTGGQATAGTAGASTGGRATAGTAGRAGGGAGGG
jgi:hypothetical protein